MIACASQEVAYFQRARYNESDMEYRPLNGLVKTIQRCQASLASFMRYERTGAPSAVSSPLTTITALCMQVYGAILRRVGCEPARAYSPMRDGEVAALDGGDASSTLTDADSRERAAAPTGERGAAAVPPSGSKESDDAHDNAATPIASTDAAAPAASPDKPMDDLAAHQKAKKALHTTSAVMNGLRAATRRRSGALAKAEATDKADDNNKDLEVQA